ncbi:MAG: hypothetical protein CMJ81_01310 [Planctomycetaceae bacterium]|jgi:hypothetical protein|nr:hypothetical protein [Planctomycetaceae bacterium]
MWFDGLGMIGWIVGPLAYVGPGPGLSMLWALVALLVTLGSALLAVLLWPLRILLLRRREKKEAATAILGEADGNTESHASAASMATLEESQDAGGSV